MRILRKKINCIIESPFMKILEFDTNSNDLLQAISDELFDKETFHISTISKPTFEFYGKIGNIKEYITKFYNGNEEELIKVINEFRDLNGVPILIENEEFYVIISDEELELIKPSDYTSTYYSVDKGEIQSVVYPKPCSLEDKVLYDD